jgi:glyoxylase-like metal-dependent hydrolase (beta-lactamase superfamily II)
VPGHQEESIALCDAKTGWLLIGDTVYPGRVMVKDWSAYRSSIERLVEFAKAHRVSAVLGSHIEMSASGYGAEVAGRPVIDPGRPKHADK